MKTVVQRVTRAEVRVGGEVVGRIERGLLLLVGVEKGDADADADATARKIAALRIFPRSSPLAGRTPMDLTVADVGGACLVVSQFTLCAALGKGNRPSFEPAADLAVETGRFGADMAVDLVNDGPVTFWIEARGGALVK